VSTAAALFRQVLDHPDEDGPRLIFADWLDEHDDPRGEFVRLQVALARLPAHDPARPDLARRERALRQAHAAEWVAPLAGQATRCTFRRGFIAAITLPAAAFVEYGAELLTLAPIRSVRLTEVAGAVDGLMVCASLARLAELDLSGNELGDLLARRLLTCPLLLGLAELALAANGLTDQTVRALSALPWTALARLDLAHNHVHDIGPLLGLHTLQHLDVSHNDLATMPKFARPLIVQIAGNPLGDAGAISFMANAHACADGTLDLSGCGITAVTINRLIDWPARQKLHTIAVDHNALGDAGVVSLVNAGGLDQLRRLRLVNVSATNPAAVALVGSDLFPRLLNLDLRDNRIGPTGVDLLWNSDRRHPQLVLKLAGNNPPPAADTFIDDDAPIKVDWTDEE